MAGNKITIDVEVNGKMEKATLSAKKLRKELDKTGAAQDGLNQKTRQGYRAAQGTAQNTSNTTKAFSKQAGVVGGLVPIYATFAANVFAVSAAFGVLSRSAAVSQLETSLENIGVSAGKNLPLVAKNLRDITNGAISTEASLRATAVATTSGFSTSQLQNLTKVATGASIALGRSLPDALDRLVRGTAKLEPEILDELGIIVRLDQATREYAGSIGKAVSDLTQFERQQAFLNATIDQGLSKYEKIAASVDPNPYDKLSAAFTDLTKTIIEFANKGLAPVAKFLSENPTALFGALIAFSSTIFSQLIPAISEFSAASSERFAMAAKAAKISAAKIVSEYNTAAKKVQVLDFMPKSFKDVAPTLVKGTKNLKTYTTAVKNLRISESRRVSEIEKLKLAQNSLSGTQLKASQAFLKVKEAELAAIKEQIIVTQQLQAIQARGATTAVIGGGSVSGAQKRATNDKRAAIGAKLEQRGLKKIEEASGPFAAIGALVGTLGLFIQNAGKAEGGAEKLAQGFKSLGGAGRLLLATFSRLIPWIAGLSIAYSLLAPIISKLLPRQSELDKKVDEAADSFSNIAKVVKVFKMELKTIDDPVVKLARSMEVAAGITDQTASAIAKLTEESDNLTLDKLNTKLEDLIDAEERLAKAQANVASARNDVVRGERQLFAEMEAKQVQRLSAEVENLTETFGTLSEADALLVIQKNIAILKSSGAFEVFPRLKYQYEELKNSLKGKGVIDGSQLTKDIEKQSEPWRRYSSAVKSAQEALRSFDAEAAKLGAKDISPFSSAITAAKNFRNEIKVASQELRNAAQVGQVPDLLGDFLNPQPLVLKPEENEIPLESLEKQIKGSIAQARFLERVLDDVKQGELKTDTDLINAQEKYNKLLIEKETALVEGKARLQEQEAILQRINNLSSLGTGFVSEQIEQEKEVKRQKIETLKAQKTLNEKIIKDQTAATIANKQVQAEIDAIQGTINDKSQEQYRLAQDTVNTRKEELAVVEKQLSVLRDQNDIARRQGELAVKRAERERGLNRFSFLTADEDKLRDQIKLAEQELARKQAFIQQEANMKKAQVALEFMLLDAKYQYLQDEAAQRISDLSTAPKGETADAKAAREERIAALDARKTAYETMQKGVGIGELKVTVDDKGLLVTGEGKGLLSQLFGGIDASASMGVAELTEEIIGLKQELLNMDPISQGLDAAAKSLSSGLSSALSDITMGAKSAKEAFADLATGILQSFQRVMFDAVTEKFLSFLTDQFKDTSIGGLFKKESVTQQASTPTPGLPNAAQTAIATTPPLAGGAMTMGAAVGTPVSIMGGLGSSAASPLYVVMGQDPLGMGGTAAAEGGAAPGGVQSVASTLGGTEGSKDTSTKATEELTKETKALNLQTASSVLAVGTLIAGLTGNEKAAKALGLALAALQTVMLVMQLIEKFSATTTTSNTAALAMNTSALYASSAAGLSRNGGVFSGTSTKNLAGYATGGIAKGARGGYPVILHGTEAVVPLPNGKSIPVEVSGGGSNSQQNNVSVNVVMNNDGSATTDVEKNRKEASDLGRRISDAVQQELRNQKRVGGMLSPYGV